MARTTIVKVLESRRKYIWPEAQLNFWLFIMLVTGSVILGINAYFMTIQTQIKAGQIWYGTSTSELGVLFLHPPTKPGVLAWLFPYSIAVGALTLLFIGIILALVGQRQLLPGIMMLGCFILFVLFLTGLIQTSIQLYGPRGSVNSYCNAYRPVSGYEQGQGIETLAYLQTKEICNDWKALFSFWIVGTVFLIWMFVMAYQVQNDVFD